MDLSERKDTNLLQKVHFGSKVCQMQFLSQKVCHSAIVFKNNGIPLYINFKRDYNPFFDVIRVILPNWTRSYPKDWVQIIVPGVDFKAYMVYNMICASNTLLDEMAY